MSTEAPAAGEFQVWGPSHLAVLAITAGVAGTMIVLARRRMERAVRMMEVALGWALLLEWPAEALHAWRLGSLNSGNALPLHFCSVAAILGGLALFTRRPGLCELLYFWGLAGTLQGLITPSLWADYPSLRFIAFFLLHGGVVTAALHVVYGRGIAPRRGAVLRAVGWMLVYAASAGATNAIINALGGNANYGFLCRKPETASLLDHLGPWPWYIGSIACVGWAIFSVLDLPFSARGRLRDKAPAGS